MTLTNKLPLAPGQRDWLEEYLKKNGIERSVPALKNAPEKLNPCVAFYGRGPANKTCKKCVHLIRQGREKTFLKCDLREITRGAATDHRAGWPACAKYQE